MLARTNVNGAGVAALRGRVLLTIAHAHAHVLPMISATDITSRRYIVEEEITFRPIPRPSEDELRHVAFTLREALKGREAKP